MGNVGWGKRLNKGENEKNHDITGDGICFFRSVGLRNEVLPRPPRECMHPPVVAPMGATKLPAFSPSPTGDRAPLKGVVIRATPKAEQDNKLTGEG